jgi:hypothetical protein
MSLGLAAVRQSVDQLAAGQEQMTRDITKLQATALGILDKISASPVPFRRVSNGPNSLESTSLRATNGLLPLGTRSKQ